jgi:hypothetical protein
MAMITYSVVGFSSALQASHHWVHHLIDGKRMAVARSLVVSGNSWPKSLLRPFKVVLGALPLRTRE